MRRLTILLALIVVSVGVRTAPGHALPASGSAALLGSDQSHGWIAFPGASGGAILAHLPPRRDPDLTTAEVDGSMKVATALAKMPESIATWEHRAFVIFPLQTLGSGSRREVMVIAAEAGRVPGTWVYGSGSRRLMPFPQLAEGGVLRGWVGTRVGPLALLEQSAELPRLVLGDGDTWQALDLPKDLPASAGAELLASRDGPVLLAGGRAWIGKLSPPSSSGGAHVVTWTPKPFYPVPEASGLRRTFAIHGGLASVRTLGPDEAITGLELWRVDHDPPRLLRSVEWDQPPRAWAVLAMDDVGRVVIATLPEEPAAPAPADESSRRSGPTPAATLSRVRLLEASAWTGEVLYEGPAKGTSPVSSKELRLLAFVLSGAMLMLVVLVVRPTAGGGGPITLPKGYALATPGRRLAAGLIDLLLVASVASWVMDVPLREVLSVTSWLASADAFHAMLLTIGLGIVYGTAWESGIGRTVGKLVCGCEVVQPRMVRQDGDELVPEAPRPTVLRAFTRNVVRWLLPPLAMAGMSTPEGRHRGDLAAGTVVAVRVRPDDAD